MDLGLRTETWQTDDQSWLGSRHGINNGRSVTLSTADFTKATHYPDGFIRSGIPLSDKGDGTFKPWAVNATTPETLAGILLTSVKAPADGTSNVVGAMLDHGRVVEAKLVGTVDAAGKDSNPHIIFV